MIPQATKLARARELYATSAKVPKLQTVANMLVKRTTDIENNEVGRVREYLPTFEELLNTEVKKGVLFTYQGEVYRTGQTRTFTDIYLPGDEGTTALYSHIRLDARGFEIWQTWDGVSGSYKLNQIVFNEADSTYYTSDLANNVYGPPHEQTTYWHITTLEEMSQYE